MVEFIKKALQNNGVQLLIVLGGVAITLINMWIAYKLAPITENLSVVTSQVQADTIKINGDEKLIPQFFIVQQHVLDEQEQLNRIESDVENIQVNLFKH